MKKKEQMENIKENYKKEQIMKHLNRRMN